MVNNSKQNKKTKKFKQQKGGAIYSFDLNDKIGGLPAWIPLNSTKDGDCPASEINDLGFSNYGITRGGSRSRSSKLSKKSKSQKRGSRKSRKSCKSCRSCKH